MTVQTHRVWVYGDDVNTDVIFPGKYTYTLKTPEEMAAVALQDLDPGFAAAVRPGDVIIAGRNWGCGSSREQAVTALKAAGVAAIIAESFNRIHFRNCINAALPPITLPGLNKLLTTGDSVQIDLDERVVRVKGQVFTFPAYSPSIQAILDAGGLIPMLQTRFQQKEA